jgi:hypothetical protein
MMATRKSKFAAAGIAGAVLLGAGGAAFAGAASSAPAGGTIHIFVNVDVKSQTTDPIVITGAIGDYGKGVDVTKSGKVDANGNYVKVTLTKGTFWVNVTALNAKTNKAPGSFNAATCSFSVSVTSPIILFKGTGLYKGISGKPKVTQTFGGIGPRLASGACNENANPVVFGGAVTGVGKVTFS